MDSNNRLVLHTDCRHYAGDKPCAKRRLCEGCDEREPLHPRILIIKQEASGDVLRTVCLAEGLKKRHPKAHIAWIARENALPLLFNNPWIDETAPMRWDAVLVLEARSFDLSICLDKEPAPAALQNRVRANEKLGFGLSPEGRPVPINPEADALFLLGLSDEEKFVRNRKSYPRLIFEACGLEYAGERYTLHLTDEEKAAAERIARNLGLDGSKPIVGLNTGAGARFANKNWPAAKYIELIRRLSPDFHLLLLGGPDELEKNREIALGANGAAIDATGNRPVREFCGLVDRCDAVVTGDTLGLHVAAALGIPAVALFGPTCEQEIDLFGRGEKLTASIDCAPCYLSHCDKTETCMDRIAVESAEQAVRRLTAGNPCKTEPSGKNRFP